MSSQQEDKKVRRFIEISAHELGWSKGKDTKAIEWQGSGLDEVGIGQIQRGGC